MSLIPEIGILSAVIIAWGGIMIRVGRAHVDRRIDKKLGQVVEDAVKRQVEPLRKQIENGLTHRQERMEDQINLLVSTLVSVAWSGEERRTL